MKEQVNAIVNEATTDATTDNQVNFNGQLTEQEKDDLEIERAKLETDKQKELKAIDV